MIARGRLNERQELGQVSETAREAKGQDRQGTRWIHRHLAHWKGIEQPVGKGHSGAGIMAPIIAVLAALEAIEGEAFPAGVVVADFGGGGADAKE